MTVTLLAVLVAAVLAVNLVVGWFVLVKDRNLLDVLGGTEWQPDDDEVGPDLDPALGSASADPGPEEDPPPLEADGNIVVCRHCGTDNRPGYRYCRWCVQPGFVDNGIDSGPDSTASQRPL